MKGSVMNLEQAKVFLEFGDDLVMSLNDPAKVQLILWAKDYDPDDPEPFEIRFGQLVRTNPDYSVRKDDGTGLVCLRLPEDQKE
jgi:hypothetical protein